jgi:hypothetical protein
LDQPVIAATTSVLIITIPNESTQPWKESSLSLCEANIAQYASASAESNLTPSVPLHCLARAADMAALDAQIISQIQIRLEGTGCVRFRSTTWPAESAYPEPHHVPVLESSITCCSIQVSIISSMMRLSIHLFHHICSSKFEGDVSLHEQSRMWPGQHFKSCRHSALIYVDDASSCLIQLCH